MKCPASSVIRNEVYNFDHLISCGIKCVLRVSSSKTGRISCRCESHLNGLAKGDRSSSGSNKTNWCRPGICYAVCDAIGAPASCCYICTVTTIVFVFYTNLIDTISLAAINDRATGISYGKSESICLGQIQLRLINYDPYFFDRFSCPKCEIINVIQKSVRRCRQFDQIGTVRSVIANDQVRVTFQFHG